MKNKSLQLVLSLWQFISPRRKIQAYFAIALILVNGLAELISLGAVLPFLTVLVNPELISSIPAFKYFSPALSVHSSGQFLFILGFLFILVSAVSSAIRVLNLYATSRLSASIASDLSILVYRNTLFKEYEDQISSNSSSIVATLTNEVAMAATAINGAFQLLTGLVVAVTLSTGLLLINFKESVTSLIVFGSIYLLISKTVKRRLSINSNLVSKSLKQQVKIIQEGLASVRDITMDGSQDLFLDDYKSIDIPLRIAVSKTAVLSAFPRYILEFAGILVLVVIALTISTQTSDPKAVMPILGAIALGAQKLLPALQLVYFRLSTIKGAEASLNSVLESLNCTTITQRSKVKPLDFTSSIEFKNVSFSYGLSEKNVAENISFTINKGQSVGFVGSTGSGKSTVVDLLMGLLTPKAGSIIVDGKDIHNKHDPLILQKWRACIAHVPQTIYLSDKTILENIAYGVNPQDIVLSRVQEAAEMANIHDYILSCEKGYQTIVGERGAKLSGGQRQRIGIARALYKKSPIIVLDEATSALDAYTESQVMASINSLHKSVTIIIIAHRLNTLDNCDTIIRL